MPASDSQQGIWDSEVSWLGWAGVLRLVRSSSSDLERSGSRSKTVLEVCCQLALKLPRSFLKEWDAKVRAGFPVHSEVEE